MLANLPAAALRAQATPEAEKPSHKAAAAAPTKPAQGTDSVASDSVAGRIGRLEGQIVDLQVMIGTLESLLRAKPGATLQHEATPAQAADGNLAPRVGALETQIGALTSQLEQIGRQLASIEARLGAAVPQSLTPPQDEPEDGEPGFRQGLGSIFSWENASSEAEHDSPRARWYGPRPGEGDPADTTATVPTSDGVPHERVAALPGAGAGAETLYRQGYGDLLQQDYPAAEAAFRQFLALYPKDRLAGNAQYWLGEAYFARGEYKSAADAFLEGYKTYKTSDKAPDTLLKLGMSLAALGQKEAACSTLGELDAKYPKAPESVRDQAKSERAKAGC